MSSILLRVLCLPMLIGTLVAAAGQATKNPLSEIPLARIGAIRWGVQSEDGGLRVERSVTNQDLARELLAHWQEAEIGPARVFGMDAGRFCLFVSTNGVPVVAMHLPHFTIPDGGVPWRVELSGTNIVLANSLLPRGTFLLPKNSSTNLWVKLRAASTTNSEVGPAFMGKSRK